LEGGDILKNKKKKATIEFDDGHTVNVYEDQAIKVYSPEARARYVKKLEKNKVDNNESKDVIFTKTYVSNFRRYCEDLTTLEYTFVHKMGLNLTRNSAVVRFNNGSPVRSYGDFAKLLSSSIDTINVTIPKLIRKKILFKSPSRYGAYFFINPYILVNGQSNLAVDEAKRLYNTSITL